MIAMMLVVVVAKVAVVLVVVVVVVVVCGGGIGGGGGGGDIHSSMPQSRAAAVGQVQFTERKGKDKRLWGQLQYYIVLLCTCIEMQTYCNNNN
jgi:hypothetical protein